MNTEQEQIQQAATVSRKAASQLANCSNDQKNHALTLMAQGLLDNESQILAANEKDLETARMNNTDPAIIDRLTLTPARVSELSEGLLAIAKLPDPVGEIVRESTAPNGLQIKQRRVPFGVITIIYEARPNVTVDSAGLCLKSGNCVLLRGSTSATHTNIKLVEIMQDALQGSEVPKTAIQIVPGDSHESVGYLLTARGFIDLVIPRGGKALIERVVTQATVPVIETGVGNCHVYIDKSADFDKAIAIAINSKTQRTSVCNTAETILIHNDIAPDFMPKLMQAFAQSNVTIHGDDSVSSFAKNAGAEFETATDADWADEYYSLDIAARVVSDLDQALDHIRKWSTGHTEAIVATDQTAIHRFTTELDSAVVMVNASTRFTDGGEFGFGAEIGISTQKLHARGPMGLTELTTTSYVVSGDGQVRN